MGFDNLLLQTCILETATRTQDADSGESTDSWAQTITGIKCRLDAKDGGLVTTPKFVYEAATHVLFLREQSVTITPKNHRIDVDGDKYEILQVQNLQDSKDTHHLEIFLSLVS